MKLDRKLLWKLFGGIAVLLIAVLFAFAYSGYINLKKVLRAEISSHATALIGQRVELQDISISGLSVATKNPGFLGGPALHLHNIAIQNPDGFANGQLLRIQELVIIPDMRALLRGKMHLTEVAVSSPEINIVHDASGRLNISEKLRQFFSKKSTSTYQLDTVSIRSGSFGLDGQKRFGLTGIDLEMNGISSGTDTKTLIKGSLVHAGENKILLDGWSLLKNAPLRFALVLTSSGFRPASLSASAHDGPLAASIVAVKLALEGDLEKGIQLSSHISMPDREILHLFTERSGTADLEARAFYDIREHSLALADATLTTGPAMVAHMSGIIRNLNQKPSYSARIRISGLDLSALGISKSYKVSGKVTSDSVSVDGTFADIIPSLSGSVRVEGAVFRSKDVELGNINGDVSLSLSTGKTLALNTVISANVQKIRETVFKKSPSVKLSLAAHGTIDAATIHTSASIAASSLPVQNGKTASFGGADFIVDGSLRTTGGAHAFSGKSSIGISDLHYGDIHIPSLQSGAGLNLTSNTMVLKAFRLETKDIRSFTGEASMRFDGKNNSYTADLRNINISIPAKKAEIKNGMFHMVASKRSSTLSPSGVGPFWGGNATFSAGDIRFHDEAMGQLSGSCRLDRENFYLDGLRAALPSGTITLTGQGKIAGGPFPLIITTVAKGLDLGQISGIYSSFAALPYQISGKLVNASFDGTVDGIDSLHGIAALEAQNLTVSARQAKRPLAKDWALTAHMDLKGRDLDFSAHAGNKGVAAETSGSIKGFAENNRTALINLHLPETQAALLREAFWDMFPDSLLYAGLDGAVSSEILLRYGLAGTNITGTLALKNLSLSGENGEYTVGPVNGILPLAYAGDSNGQEKSTMPVFDRAEFDALSKDYSRQFTGKGYNKITIGSLRYGFRLLDSISLWVKREGTALDAGRFSANIFGGTFNGSAFATIGKGVNYRIGFIVDGLSLTKLCNDIDPIKGYISGKLNGVASFKGTGANLPGLIGIADFWTYSDKKEKTKISKEFLQKLGGPSMGSYLSERDFDTGIISVYAQKGYLFFQELEISNRNFFGMKDLSIKVAPYHNRISIEDLMWDLVEAAHRAKEKQSQ